MFFFLNIEPIPPPISFMQPMQPAQSMPPQLPSQAPPQQNLQQPPRPPSATSGFCFIYL